MARFNKKAPVPAFTINQAGGSAIQHDPKMELFLLAATSFLNDQFYRSANQTMDRITELLKQVPVEFAIQVSLYVRHKLGLRSVSHFIAATIASKLSGHPLGASYYHSIIGRPDDMGEILSCFKDKLKQEAMPNCMKKGFARYLESCYDYKLGKYKMVGKDFNIYDIVNLCHPQSTQSLKRLMTGTLKTPDTWETMLSKAGADTFAQAHTWFTLIANDNLGYLALLRNLRNIRARTPVVVYEAALEQLQEKNRIQESRIMPFQFAVAMNKLKSLGDRKLQTALGNALNTVMENAPQITKGRLLVAIDVSGSMYSTSNGRDPIDHAAILGAALWKSNPQAEIMLFSDKMMKLGLRDTMDVTSIMEDIKKIGQENTGGTNISQVIGYVATEMNKGSPYDAVILISDMQDWIENNAIESIYKQLHTPIIMLDCAGYGTKIARGVYTVGGLTDKVFDLMRLIVSGEGDCLTALRDASALLK